MRFVKIISTAAAIILLTSLVTKAEVLINLRDGKETKKSSITYKDNTLTLSDGKTIKRDNIKSITLTHEQNEKKQTNIKPTEDIKELLKMAEDAVKRFPNSKLIILKDYGHEEKHEDGTRLLQYRIAAKITHPDSLSIANRSISFDEERNSARIIQARSIDSDGTIHNYDPNAVKISKPSREEQHFGRGKIITYQIPEVKIGSIVDCTYEWNVFNPYDSEMFFPGWYFASENPFVHSRFEVVIPRNEELHYSTSNMPEESVKPRVIYGQQNTTYIWEMKNKPGFIKEPDMPPVSDVLPRLEATTFKDWLHIKKWASDRLLPRMEPNKELTSLVEGLTKDIEKTKDKAAILYHYVQQNIQYISIKSSVASNICGHYATETFKNKYGDCIDTAILLSTFLRIAGIEAYPIWIATNDQGAILTDIPSLAGNHAIVEMHLNNNTLFLDPTGTYYRYPALREDNHGSNYINPILARVGIVPLPDPKLQMTNNKINLTLTPKGDATAKYMTVRTGSKEAYARSYFQNSNKEQIQKTFQSIASSYSPGAKLTSHYISNPADLSIPLEWRMEFDMPQYTEMAGTLMILKIPDLDYSFPEVALKRRAFSIDYKTSSEKKHEFTVNIPEGYKINYLPPEVEFSSKHVSYKASCKIDNGKIIFKDRFRRSTRFVPIEDYSEHKKLLQKIARYSKEHIFFEKAE